MHGAAGSSEIDGICLRQAFRGLFLQLCDGIPIEMRRDCHTVIVPHDMVHLSVNDAEKWLEITDAAVQHVLRVGAVAAIAAAADEYELTGPGQQFAHLLIGIGKDAAARSLDPAAKTANAGACRIHGGKDDSRRLGGS